MISVKDLTFVYEGARKAALSGVSMEIRQGGFVGVIGPSGAGKTTLLSCMNGIIPHHFKGDYYGSVKICGKDTFDCSLTELSLVAGTVFQDVDGMLINATVEDEVLYGLENFGLPKAEIAARLEEVLEEVGIAGLRRRSISTLSGGQKQKVAIAAVLALRPQILLLDEPTGELDPASSRLVFSLLKRLNRERGITVVAVEQKIMLLSEFASELAVMSEGRLEFFGPVREVLRHSEELEKIGVNCPRVVALSRELEKRGLTAGTLCVSVDEAEAEVRRVLEG